MNPEIKSKWISALRSGKYPQEQQTLHSENGYCCLGVLCDLYLNETQTEDYKWDIGCGGRYYFAENTGREEWSVDYLPVVVMDWAGLNSENPFIEYDGCNMEISDLNDEGNSFQVIADVIEEQL